ncbi:TIGR00341 family protein [Pedobacter nyackensis]|uniref:TIGR00341 family protein n=1 Tax=Pedobacter nyackensis TaxID=475255 RepID=UPI00292ECA5B|nr:TIGR00341 family protein [Pedobacter nyackensis]
MKEVLRTIANFISYRFNLHEDNADEQDTVEALRKNVEFKGANLWTLIFAIFIASIGLNVNSTAVIIGAMLISPLMGPIMGVGLGIGINDFELVKKALRNLFIATLISVTASMLYFWISPLSDVSSELLARTSPTIWDVFIAGFGGLAGMVAATRKEKSNAIPGVAIATALMPPLCTAGFGIATGNLYFFFGAMYLYFINSVFICVATYLIVRYLKFHKKEFEDERQERKVKRYILLTVLITATPSVYLAYRIVDKSIFQNNANTFIEKEMHYRNTQVMSKNFKYNSKGNEIDLLLFGNGLSESQIDSLRSKLPKYKLGNTKLVIRQGIDAKNELDYSQIKASILEAVYKNDPERNETATSKLDIPIPDISGELKSLYPQLSWYSINHVVSKRLDANFQDTITVALVSFKSKVSDIEVGRMQKWLKNRIKSDSVKVVFAE